MQCRNCQYSCNQNKSDQESSLEINIIKEPFLKQHRPVCLTVISMEKSGCTECSKRHRTSEQCLPSSVYPIIKAIIVITPIESPSVTILAKKSLVRMDSSFCLGFSSITSFLCGSSPRAIAGRLSVNRLINNR